MLEDVLGRGDEIGLRNLAALCQTPFRVLILSQSPQSLLSGFRVVARSFHRRAQPLPNFLLHRAVELDLLLARQKLDAAALPPAKAGRQILPGLALGERLAHGVEAIAL